MTHVFKAAFVAVAILGLTFGGVVRVFAHEGHTHNALGTIASVQGARLEIKTTDGKTLTVGLRPATPITRGKEKLTAAALKVGERVSVDYREENKAFVAAAIKLGTASSQAGK